MAIIESDTQISPVGDSQAIKSLAFENCEEAIVQDYASVWRNIATDLSADLDSNNPQSKVDVFSRLNEISRIGSSAVANVDVPKQPPAENISLIDWFKEISTKERMALELTRSALCAQIRVADRQGIIHPPLTAREILRLRRDQLSMMTPRS